MDPDGVLWCYHAVINDIIGEDEVRKWWETKTHWSILVGNSNISKGKLSLKSWKGSGGPSLMESTVKSAFPPEIPASRLYS